MTKGLKSILEITAFLKTSDAKFELGLVNKIYVKNGNLKPVDTFIPGEKVKPILWKQSRHM